MAAAVITEDVKSLKFDGISKPPEPEIEPSSILPLKESTFGNVTGIEGVEREDVPDLVTLEQEKKYVQKNVHEQESFWSWFCFRSCFDCCYWPYPHCYCGVTPADGSCFCCSCGNCDCGNCCGDCDCGSCCNDGCCLGCAQCCTDCLSSSEPCLVVGEGMGACCSAC